MKQVRVQAVVDYSKCSGCDTCAHVCPTMAYVPNLSRPIRREANSPCNAECPIGNDIEGILQFLQQENWKGAYELLLETNPLPAITGRVCHSPCEKACNRTEVDGAVSIRALERALGDWGHRNPVRIIQAPPQKEKVAVIGSGPSGLSCACHLKRKGYSVTVFEQNQEIGGILRYGIPGYRLPKAVLDQELDRLEAMGVNFCTGAGWGGNLPESELESYQAVFLGVGFQGCRTLGIPGEDLPQIIRGADFLAEVNSGRMTEIGSRVLIIGGGNSAVDSARTALRLKAWPVVFYRRTEQDMPAIAGEVEELKKEGVEIHTLVSPVRYLSDNGRLKEVECIRMELGEMQADGRRWPEPVAGAEFRIAADTVIHCIGETGDLDGYPLELGCAGEKIDADAWGRTSIPKVFAGGDIATGKGTVADAIFSGQRGAVAIDCFIKGKSAEEPPEKRVVPAHEMNFDYCAPMPRVVIPRIAADIAVTGFQEGVRIALGRAGICRIVSVPCPHAEVRVGCRALIEGG